VCGTTGDLLMLVTGRRQVLPALSGPGIEVLAGSGGAGLGRWRSPAP
jgi:hypothetical protein